MDVSERVETGTPILMHDVCVERTVSQWCILSMPLSEPGMWRVALFALSYIDATTHAGMWGMYFLQTSEAVTNNAVHCFIRRKRCTVSVKRH